MHKSIVSDTSCFIILTIIDDLHLLQKTFGKIVTTKEVIEEFGEELPSWIQIKSPTQA